MTTNEKLFSNFPKAMPQVSRAAEVDSDTRNVLWTFPAHDGRSRRGRELGQKLIALAFGADALVIISALLLTFYIRFETPLRTWGTDAKPELIDYLGYIMLASVFYLGMLCYGGVYDHRHLLKLRAVTAPIIKWSVAWVGLILLASFLVKFQPPISRVFCLMAWVITPGMLILWRSIFRLILARTSAASALRLRVVFVGWNQYAAHLARNFDRSHGLAYHVIGYIHGHADEKADPAIAYLGSIEEAERIVS